jgi:hypothetical protein
VRRLCACGRSRRRLCALIGNEAEFARHDPFGLVIEAFA